MRIAEIYENVMLSEKRRNPQVNKKVDMLEALEKYRGQKNVFVSYTADVGQLSHGKGKTVQADSRHVAGIRSRGEMQNASGAKLGINPRSEYSTPIGIYAYPVNYVLDTKGGVEFAGNLPFAQVFQAHGNFLDLDLYTDGDYEADREKLLTKFRWARSTIAEAEREAKSDTPSAKIWNATRLVADKITAHMNSEADDDRPDEDDFDSYEEYEEAYAEWEQNDRVVAKAPVQWSKILRDLGYDGALDLGAKGIIHANEPTQAVFFSIKAVKPLELLHNISPQEEMSQDEIYLKNPKIIANLMKKGKISDERVISLLKSNEYALRNVGFDNLTPSVQAYLVNHPDEFLSQYSNDLISAAYKQMSLTTLTRILDKDPWRINDIHQPTPALMRWVVKNFGKFEKYFGHFKLPPKIMLQLVQQDPNLIEFLPSDPADVPHGVQLYTAQAKPEKVAEWLRGYRWSSVKPDVIATWFKTWSATADTYRIKQNLNHFLSFEDRPPVYARRAITACVKMLPKNKAKALVMELNYHPRDRVLLKLLLAARPDMAEYLKTVMAKTQTAR